MNLAPREKDKLMIALAAMVGARPSRERHQTQLSREYRPDNGLRSGRSTRRQIGGGAHVRERQDFDA